MTAQTASEWVQAGAPWVDADPDGRPRASVRFQLGGTWTLTVQRDLSAATAGPTSLTLEATHSAGDGAGDADRSPRTSEGIQFEHMRRLPIKAARKALEPLWIEHKASEVIAKIPDPFDSGALANARLAVAVATLTGWGVRNPVAVIARGRSEDTVAAWTSRVKRAHQAGWLGRDADGKPYVTNQTIGMISAS